MLVVAEGTHVIIEGDRIVGVHAVVEEKEGSLTFVYRRNQFVQRPVTEPINHLVATKDAKFEIRGGLADSVQIEAQGSHVLLSDRTFRNLSLSVLGGGVVEGKNTRAENLLLFGGGGKVKGIYAMQKSKQGCFSSCQVRHYSNRDFFEGALGVVG